MKKIDLEKFNKDGYLIVDNVFSMKEMDLLNNVVKDILLYKYNNMITLNNSKKIYINKSHILESIPQKIAQINRSEFDNITESICHLPEFLRMVSKRNIQLIANILMKQDKLNPL